jgi:hypothetical protein
MDLRSNPSRFAEGNDDLTSNFMALLPILTTTTGCTLCRLPVTTIVVLRVPCDAWLPDSCCIIATKRKIPGSICALNVARITHLAGMTSVFLLLKPVLSLPFESKSSKPGVDCTPPSLPLE